METGRGQQGSCVGGEMLPAACRLVSCPLADLARGVRGVRLREGDLLEILLHFEEISERQFSSLSMSRASSGGSCPDLAAGGKSVP